MAALPDGFEPTFQMNWRVETSDMDELDHVSNVVYVYWIQELARAHSDAVGLPFEVYKELGAIFMVKKHEVEYLRPCFAGDELVMGTWIDGWKPASCVRHSRIIRLKDGVHVAEAQTTWVWASLTEGRPRRIPSNVKDIFQSPFTDKHTPQFSPSPSS